MGLLSLNKLTGNGSLVEIEGKISELYQENNTLKELVNVVLSIVKRQEAHNSVVNSKLEDIQESLTKATLGVEEVKTTDYYGKRRVLLPQALEEVSKLSNSEIRSLIHKAARAHKGGQRKGYTHIYEKLRDITGIDVYEMGKVPLKRKHGIEGWKKDPSYINTILLKGVQKEAAVVAMETLNRK